MLDELLHRVDPDRYTTVFAGLHEGSWTERLRPEGFPVHVVPQTRWRDVRNVASVAGGLARHRAYRGADRPRPRQRDRQPAVRQPRRPTGQGPRGLERVRPVDRTVPRKLLTARRHVTARFLAEPSTPTPSSSGPTVPPKGCPAEVDTDGHHPSRHRRRPVRPRQRPTGPRRAGDRRRRPVAGHVRPADVPQVPDRLRPGHGDRPARPCPRPGASSAEGEATPTTASASGPCGRTLGLEEQILLPGFVPDQLKDDIMAAADIVVHLAQRESFGLAVVEAQAAGKVVVAADASGPRSLIDDGSTGVLVPVGDVDRLAQDIIGLLGDPVAASRAGFACRGRRPADIPSGPWSTGSRTSGTSSCPAGQPDDRAPCTPTPGRRTTGPARNRSEAPSPGP